MNKKNTNTKKFYSKGFTLIELLVVMVILAALVFIAASSFQSAQMKARDAERKSALRQMGNALETYYADRGEYPDNNSSFEIVGCGTLGSEVACTVGNEFSITSGGGETIYMTQLPGDPLDGNYRYVSDGRSYQIYARLENHKDQGVKNPDDDDPNSDASKDTYGSLTCLGSMGCNFGLSSSNVSLEPVLN